METLLLTRSDIAQTLTMRDCIPAVEAAFRQLGEGKAQPPQTLGLHVDGGGFHIKAAVLELGARSYFVAKTNGNFPRNSVTHDLPTIQGVALLCDATNGRVLALMDSVELTARRTAAATAVAARLLARQDARTLALIGCGVQGYAQAEAVASVLPIERIIAYDVNSERAKRFITGSKIEARAASSAREAAIAADIIVTCTTSYDFVLDRTDVRPGTFVAGVGVDNEEKKELHPELLASSKVVTDLAAQCVKIGDLHHAIAANVMAMEGVHADLAQVVAGERAGRASDTEITVFDSTGLAIQDVAAAVIAYERALGTGAARSMRLTD